MIQVPFRKIIIIAAPIIGSENSANVYPDDLVVNPHFVNLSDAISNRLPDWSVLNMVWGHPAATQHRVRKPARVPTRFERIRVQGSRAWTAPDSKSIESSVFMRKLRNCQSKQKKRKTMEI